MYSFIGMQFLLARHRSYFNDTEATEKELPTLMGQERPWCYPGRTEEESAVSCLDSRRRSRNSNKKLPIKERDF
jgi:hypothetical protein